MSTVEELDEAPVAATRNGSILGAVRAEVAEATEQTTRDLPVGKSGRLYARYRALTEDERTEFETAARHRQRLRRKIDRNGGDDGVAEREAAALLLAKCCEMLLWLRDDGSLVPLHEALAEEGVEAPGPLRYNAEMVAVLDLADELRLPTDRTPSSVEIVTSLHRWGKDYMPLLTTSKILSMWISSVSAEALQEAAEGM